MSSMDFALMPEPSRQGLVQFDASEIVRLWGEQFLDVHRLAHKLQQTPSRYRVAAILPSQELDDTAFAELERSGWLVVEVPESLTEASNDRIAAYLTTQLSEGRQETLQRVAAMGTSDAATQVDDGQDLEMSDDAEAEFLEFVNDPANQLGGHF